VAQQLYVVQEDPDAAADGVPPRLMPAVFARFDPDDDPPPLDFRQIKTEIVRDDQPDPFESAYARGYRPGSDDRYL
jgi:hypothetical protein